MRKKQVITFGAASRFAGIFWAVLLMACPLLAQTPDVPQVPATIRFADMTLHLTEKAQREIQADVDALYRSPKYFYMKLERVDLYLPIIEPIFAELGIPDDFKYLVIQESALISDAVSSSNAVGFWQFKEASATEVGMRVDRQVDERMNIVGSTTGAARYLLRSNAAFDNWLYSLQSYQMGQGGATRALDKRYYGARELKIDGDTYWYVKKFLSHLVAFRDAVGKQPRSQMLYQYKGGANKTLASIAEEFDTPVEQLEEYNKWLRTSRVPDDKPYVVLIPVQIEEAPNLLAESQGKPKQDGNRQNLEDKLFGEKQKQPDVPAAEMDKLVITRINKMKAVVARPGDNARDLAKAGSISVADFLKYNDIRPGDLLKTGQVYYFQRKKKKASVYRHVTAQDESLWDISQKYGVRLDKLLQKNRMKKLEQIKPGQVVWLRYIRPANEPIAFEPVPQKAEARAAAPDPIQVVQPQPKPQPQPQPQLQKEAPQPEQQAVQQKLVASTADTALPLPDKQLVAEEAKEAQPSSDLRFAQQPPLAADTPAVKKAPALLPVQAEAPRKAQPDTLKSSQPERHLYPGAAEAQRNVSPENAGKDAGLSPAGNSAGSPAGSPPTRPVVDPFAAQTSVTFIDEQGRPLKTEDSPDTQKPLPVQPASPQAVTAAQPLQQTGNTATGKETATPPAARDSVHVVQAGETLYSLSRRYGLSVQELRSYNNMNAEGVLSIGQALRLLPQPAASQPVGETPLAVTVAEQPVSDAPLEDSRFTYHTVAEGETMYRVARKYNVTIKDIMEWNKKQDFALKPGETLVVGKK